MTVITGTVNIVVGVVSGYMVKLSQIVKIVIRWIFERTVIKMLSKYLQYFLDANDLEINEEFTLVYEDGSDVYRDGKIFFFKKNPYNANDILACKQDEKFYSTALLNLLTGLFYVKKKPWQPRIGDTYFYIGINEETGKGAVHLDTLYNNKDIKYLLLQKLGKCYRTYCEAEKHLEQDYKELVGESND